MMAPKSLPDKSVEFWYEFASSYSYPAAMRVQSIATSYGVEVIWKPFLLGPIFKQQGLDYSPFKIFKTKGTYMWRDVERICDELALDFHKPEKFPQNGLIAARLALTDEVAKKIPAFSQAVYRCQFSEREVISNVEKLRAIIESLGLDSEKAFEQSQSAQVKLALRTQTEQAAKKGVFGAPMFITSDGEMFWGNDRLEQAVAWAAGSGHKR